MKASSSVLVSKCLVSLSAFLCFTESVSYTYSNSLGACMIIVSSMMSTLLAGDLRHAYNLST